MTTKQAAATYSKQTLERLSKILAQYELTVWVNPATNSIDIKNMNFMQAQKRT